MRAHLLVLLAGARALLEIQAPERLRGTLPTGASQFYGPQRFHINASLILLDFRDARWIHESKDGEPEVYDDTTPRGSGQCALHSFLTQSSSFSTSIFATRNCNSKQRSKRLPPGSCVLIFRASAPSAIASAILCHKALSRAFGARARG